MAAEQFTRHGDAVSRAADEVKGASPANNWLGVIVQPVGVVSGLGYELLRACQQKCAALPSALACNYDAGGLYCEERKIRPTDRGRFSLNHGKRVPRPGAWRQYIYEADCNCQVSEGHGVGNNRPSPRWLATSTCPIRIDSNGCHGDQCNDYRDNFCAVGPWHVWWQYTMPPGPPLPPSPPPSPSPPPFAPGTAPAPPPPPPYVADAKIKRVGWAVNRASDEVPLAPLKDMGLVRGLGFDLLRACQQQCATLPSVMACTSDRFTSCGEHAIGSGEFGKFSINRGRRTADGSAYEGHCICQIKDSPHTFNNRGEYWKIASTCPRFIDSHGCSGDQCNNWSDLFCGKEGWYVWWSYEMP